MRISIRIRLTLWNSLAFGVVLVGFAGLVYLLASRALRQQADRAAETAFRLVETDPRLSADPDVRIRYWVHEFEEHMGVLAAVYRLDGAPVVVHPELAKHFPRLARQFSDQSSLSSGRFIRTDPTGDRWEAANKTVKVGDQELVFLLLIPLRETDTALSLLGRVLIGAVPLGLLASSAVAYILARKALAPVDSLRRSADAITADRLSDRIPVANPDDELGKLAVTFNAMIIRLEQSFSEMKRFTADASHELRTPLTAIRIEAESVLDRGETLDEYKVAVGSILEECGRMVQLTDQLLALAREDAGIARIETKPVNLGEVIGGVAEALRPVIEAKRITLVTEVCPVEISGDSVRLRQVAMNLINNAIKYTMEGGSIKICVKQYDSQAVFTITDTGIGIPPEHLGKVFDRFYRVEKSRSTEKGGTGLGLSIARSIVSAHGGSIALTSNISLGTTVTVTLPFNTPLHIL